jgi:hypothetical protein
MMLIAVAPVAARSLIAARVSGNRVPGPHQIYGFLTTEAKCSRQADPSDLGTAMILTEPMSTIQKRHAQTEIIGRKK